MSEFKRSRMDKNGKKKEYWYIRYTLNGKDKWESVYETFNNLRSNWFDSVCINTA